MLLLEFNFRVKERVISVKLARMYLISQVENYYLFLAYQNVFGENIQKYQIVAFGQEKFFVFRFSFFVKNHYLCG